MNPTGTVQPQVQPLDPQVVNLAKAIRQTESGGNFNAKGASGESGAYQWMPATWQAHAQDALGDKNAPMTPANQNAVAYTVIKQWKDEGLNPAQIAAKWNSGSENNWENKIGTNSMGVAYNVPKYVKSVTDAYQQIKLGNQVGADPNNPSSTAAIPQPNPSGAWMPASPNDTALEAGVKATVNTIPSAFNFAKGVAEQANPLNVAGNIQKIGSGFSDLASKEGTGQALWDVIKGLPKATYDTFMPQGLKQLISGDAQGASQTFTNDPFGQAAPLVLALEGGAKLADTAYGLSETSLRNSYTENPTPNTTIAPKPTPFSDALSTGISTLAKPVTGTIGAVASLPIKGGLSIVSHLTGLDPQTITSVLSEPASFSKIKQEAMDRPTIAQDFGNALDEMTQRKTETGREYQPIRESQTQITVPTNFIDSLLEKYGLKVTPDIIKNKEGQPINNPESGKVVADTNSVTRNKGDISAIQNFYDNWGKKKTLTPNEFLNMRSDTAEISKFDSTKSSASATIGKDLYAKINQTLRPQIKGLQELDARMSPQIEQFKKAKKDFLNADGTFKDGAINKIANATGKGKEALLSRMEEISPGITKRIQILKAVEDIQRANGIKVGTYTRGIIEGTGVLTGNIPVIVGAILTHPTIAVQIIRGFGLTGKAVLPVVNYLQLLTGDIAKPTLVSGIVNKDNKAPLLQNKK